MSADDIAALGAAYVEGDLDPISRSHLAEVVQQEPAQADVLAQQMRTHLLLRALLHQGAATEVVRRARLIPRGFTADRSKRLVDSARALNPQRPSTSRPYASMRWITAVSVGVLAALVVIVLLPQPQPPQVSADAGVRIVRAGHAVGATGELRANDMLITAANQRAELTWTGEGTRLALDPDTQVQALGGRGKRFRLDHGALAVRAATQPLHAPLVLQTARAQATVVGTAFSLTADPFTTWLAVEHGSVRFGLHGGTEVLVGSGERALAAERVTIIPRDRGCGLLGAYFRTNHLTDQALVRLDPVIDFDWASSEPAPGLTHPFSVRWSGLIEARFAETYRFYVPSDDGVRLWIDERLVFDNWRVQSFIDDGRRYGVFTFSEDRLRVPIRLEYYEQFTLAAVRLSWESPNTPRAVVPASALFPVKP